MRCTVLCVPFQVIEFSPAAIAAFIAMVGILSIIAQVFCCYISISSIHQLWKVSLFMMFHVNIYLSILLKDNEEYNILDLL